MRSCSVNYTTWKHIAASRASGYRGGEIILTTHPKPDEIKEARKAAGLTQTAAAKLVSSGLRTWQQWEAGDRKMHPAIWEFFKIRTGTYN
jgi:DNA-binding transcriptional regulator YiaG